MPFLRLSICLSYCGLLTVLLLSPDPASVVKLSRVPTFPWGDFGTHFTALALLAILVHGSRWPRPLAWPLVVGLLIYGLATETLQRFVPHRAVELVDYIENILGVFAGTYMYWFIRHLFCRRRRISKSTITAAPPPVSSPLTADP